MAQGRRAAAFIGGVVVFAMVALTAASFLPGRRSGDVSVLTPGELDATRPPASCPVTIPEGDFVPPERYHPGFRSQVAEEGAWYGSQDLWTILDREGEVWFPFRGVHGQPKLFLWSIHQERATDEPRPDVELTAERIDGKAPIARNETSTHGWVESNLFMITSIVLPTPGCWEITAEYRGTSLDWVVWATERS